MSKKEKRVTLIRFDPRRIRRLRPLARLVSGLLPWCGPLSLLAGCTAMALARLSLRQLLLELCMTELLVALSLALPGIALHTSRTTGIPHGCSHSRWVCRGRSWDLRLRLAGDQCLCKHG